MLILLLSCCLYVDVLMSYDTFDLDPCALTFARGLRCQQPLDASAVKDMLLRNRQELLGDRLSSPVTSQTPPAPLVSAVTSQPRPRVQLEELPVLGDYAQVKVRKLPLHRVLPQSPNTPTLGFYLNSPLLTANHSLLPLSVT